METPCEIMSSENFCINVWSFFHRSTEIVENKILVFSDDNFLIFHPVVFGKVLIYERKAFHF